MATATEADNVDVSLSSGFVNKRVVFYTISTIIGAEGCPADFGWLKQRILIYILTIFGSGPEVRGAGVFGTHLRESATLPRLVILDPSQRAR